MNPVQEWNDNCEVSDDDEPPVEHGRTYATIRLNCKGKADA